MSNIQQFPLDLALQPRYCREDFLVGPSNADALLLIESWPDWPERVLVLTGPKGSGKTHLAHIFATSTEALFLDFDDFLTKPAELFSRSQTFVLENCDQLRGLEAEKALFHGLNLLRQSGRYLLITAELARGHWEFVTADLVSRLRLAPMICLHSPDDNLLRAVLVKQFDDRQLVLDPGIIDYIVRKIPRSYAAIRSTVSALDQEALARSKPVTRMLVNSVLEEIAEAEEDEG